MSIELQVRKARSLAKSGQMAAARDLLQEVQLSYPSNARVKHALAEVSSLLRAATDPDPEAMQSLGALRTAGNFREALTLARALLELIRAPEKMQVPTSFDSALLATTRGFTPNPMFGRRSAFL